MNNNNFYRKNYNLVGSLFSIQYKIIYKNNIIKLTTFGRSFVLEWQTVTVALCHFNNSATGVPTILLLPKTTACAPAIGTPLL